MSAPEHAQIYLITPPDADAHVFPETLAQVLDQTDVACVRLALASQSQDDVAQVADAVRSVTHARDVALVIENHLQLVSRLGLDGVHLSDLSVSIRDLREDLGEDAVIGAHARTSRHDGMTAGEAGADYVSFGPVGGSTLGDGAVADPEIFEWWSAMIELPVVAEGHLNADIIRRLAPHTDFFGIGPEIWSAENPAQALADLANLIKTAES